MQYTPTAPCVTPPPRQPTNVFLLFLLARDPRRHTDNPRNKHRETPDESVSRVTRHPGKSKGWLPSLMQGNMRMVRNPGPVRLEVVPVASLRIEFLRPDIRQLVLVKREHLLDGSKIAGQRSAVLMWQEREPP